MATSIRMPELGESISEGTITRWLKHEGDRVEVDEPLFEVSTDKVDTEVPSPVAGVVRSIRVQEDETVPVGTELVEIGADGAARRAPSKPERAEPAAQPAAAREAPQRAEAPAAQAASVATKARDG